MLAITQENQEALQAGEGAGLVHVDPAEPGFTRRALKNGFGYYDLERRRIRERSVVTRLDAIALPPAYTQAWYAPIANAHLLATGIDAAGRRQYRYHPSFSAHRDALKFAGCAQFGEALGRIRAQVAHDLSGRSLTQARAIASVVRLLDTGRIRVGNEDYARANGSFGATTLRRRHVRIARDGLHLRFKAKSGRTCDMTVSDRGLLRFVKQVMDLPGQSLFRYRDEDGHFHPITSTLVNDYIREASGQDYTAKDFRTWRASVLAFAWLYEEASEKPTLKAMLDYVSTHLCNTPAMARKAYIHPLLIAAVAQPLDGLRAQPLPRRTKWLERHERGLAAYLASANASTKA